MSRFKLNLNSKSKHRIKVAKLDVHYCSRECPLILNNNKLYYLFIKSSSNISSFFPPPVMAVSSQSQSHHSAHKTHHLSHNPSKHQLSPSNYFLFSKLPVPINRKSRLGMLTFLNNHTKRYRLVISTKKKKVVLQERHSFVVGCRMEGRVWKEKMRKGNRGMNKGRSGKTSNLVIRWFKDGVRLQNSHTYSKKNKAVLRIRHVSQQNQGVYRCVSIVKGRKILSKKVHLIVKSGVRRGHLHPCERQDFCMNGGVCTVLATLKKTYCLCKQGFEGRRCEEKRTGQRRNTVKTNLPS